MGWSSGIISCDHWRKNNPYSPFATCVSMSLRTLAMTHPIQAVKPMLRALLNVLFPVFCPICGRSIPDSAFLCTHCITTLPPLPKNYCLTCGTSTQGTVSECGTCLYEIGLPERVYFAFLYLEPLSRLIVRYKFHDRSEWAEPLADLLMERIVLLCHI